MSSGNLKRAVRGYAVGAGVIVVAVSAALGPWFPLGLVFGTLLAIAVGLVIVLPVCLLLYRLDQLRPWWAALLGAVALIFPLSQVNSDFRGVDYQGVDRSYVIVKLEPTGEVTPNWPAIGVTAFGALAGLIGWAAAYGLRMKPPPATQALAPSEGET